MRFRYDAASFARYCFPERFDRPFNAFQRSLLEQEKERWESRQAPDREATAAPRGYAKSTIGSFVEVLHDIVYDLEVFIVILSNGADLAIDLVEDLKVALEDPESPLNELYGPFDVDGTKSDFTVSVRGRPSIRLLAKSFGKQIRGIKHRGRRPSKVLVDDGEHSDRVRSPDQRRKTWAYLTSDILKVGYRYTTYRIRGTVLHPDSMLANALGTPGWRSKKWRAIISWPKRPELWAQCHAIWADLTNEFAVEDAKAFYELNRAEMDEGAEVLDPIGEPLFACYEAIWSEGLAAFLREKQNDPTDPSTRLFDLSTAARCKVAEGKVITAEGREVPFGELVFYAHLDPALGKKAGMPGDTGSGAGDYGAIAVIGRDRFGYGFVVEVWMRRARPDQQLEALWEIHERWGLARASIESNGFQALIGRDFRKMQEERRKADKVWQLPIDEDESTSEKTERIASMQPAVANRWLQFSTTLPPEVTAQIEEFPTGSHDDAPDAIEAAWRMSRAPRQSGGRVV
jgi:predicted phage terminase large subunit-like protein